jgi:uncharacterized membrane protein YqjE
MSVDTERAAAPPGLIAALAAVARNSLRLLLSRVELAALELSELRNHLAQLVMVYALLVLAAWFAIAFACATLIYLAWTAIGWLILLILAGGFALLALGLWWYARQLLRQGTLSLPVTMAELKADRDALL